MNDWHAQPLHAVLKELSATSAGLTAHEAVQRQRRYGSNELAPPPRESLFFRVASQLRDPMILVLLAAAGLSLWAGGGRDWLDAAIILGIVVVNSVISIAQEDRARHALEALRRMSAPLARVVRDGQLMRLEARELVPGDVIVLEAGDQVGADARILECASLRCDESAMTGESAPVEKSAADTLPPDAPLAERSNLVLSGTLVTAGRGKAVVVATGMDTQMGHIASLLMGSGQSRTPLQRRMGEISRILSLVCLCVCAVMFGVGLIQGKALLPMLLTAVSLAVAAIPEGLSAIVTIVLALGVQRMASRGAIVKKLPAVETLGCAGVVCSDKTGTLTQNRMEVQELWLSPGAHRQDLLRCAALCNDARLVWRGGAPASLGDPTEGALVVAAAREGVDRNKLAEQMPRVGEIPFDSQRKRMTTLHNLPQGGCVAMVKGAPDLLLDRCTATPAGPLDQSQRRRILRANADMARRALRVIAVARRELPQTPLRPQADQVEEGLTFLGLLGMSDPPRPEVKEAVARCQRAGIRPVMITGDHPDTAVAVAREVGIFQPGDLSITGGELDFLPQKALEEDIGRFSVFARVTPEHKLRIVQAWQKRGQVVAMTGDGVNDAPALKAADIGCAMGRTGTDVAKQAADMILTDDNFSTIVAAVEEGRGIYANIRKAIHYLLSCNIGEILTIFTATILGFKTMPLSPVQLLWLNLVTDSLPALALGVEGVEAGAMDRPPRPAGENLFTRSFTLRLVWQGAMVGALTLGAYLLGWYRLGGSDPAGTARTMAFATLTLSQLFHAYNVRSEYHSLFTQGALSNPAMNRAFLVGLALQMAVLLLPPLRAVFGVVSLGGTAWVSVLALSMAPIPICEWAKAAAQRRPLTPPQEEAQPVGAAQGGRR